MRKLGSRKMPNLSKLSRASAWLAARLPWPHHSACAQDPWSGGEGREAVGPRAPTASATSACKPRLLQLLRCAGAERLHWACAAPEPRPWGVSGRKRAAEWFPRLSQSREDWGWGGRPASPPPPFTPPLRLRRQGTRSGNQGGEEESTNIPNRLSEF